MTNTVIDYNGNIVYGADNTIKQWGYPSNSSNFCIRTKDFDFNAPSQRKKIHKVEIVYYSNSLPNASFKYAVDGDSSNFVNISEAGGLPLNDNNSMQSFKINTITDFGKSSIYTIQFKIEVISGQQIPQGFHIDDISVIYRLKPIN
tara:strand:- start:1688 stop:2125 length:438 start_codon:yes stop_codon:yes gene_type:complete